MTRIVCLSDTHTRTAFEVPPGDVLVHAGDATFRGDYAEVWDFAQWYGRFPHEHKIFVAGNHDWGFQKQPDVFREMMSRVGVTYFEDSGMEIRGLTFWGSPWQPEFNNWAFNLSRYEGELARKWSLIPDDTQVLITHGPPKGIQDRTLGYTQVLPYDVVYEPPRRVGCHDLMERIKQLSALRLKIHGHIHAGYGIEKIGKVTYVNGSICNERYNPINEPIIVDL